MPPLFFLVPTQNKENMQYFCNISILLLLEILTAHSIGETERAQEYKVLYKHFSMFPSRFVSFPLYNVSTLPTIPFLLCYIQSWKWAGLKGLEHLMQEYKRLDYDLTLDIFHTYQNKKTNPSQNLLLKIAKKLASEYIKIPS